MEAQVCVDCACTSPKTNTDYTLISAQHGWRLARERDASGRVALAWRCPECWRRRKESRVVSAPPRVVPETPAPTPSLKSGETPRGIFARARRRLLGQISEPPPGQ